MLPRRLAGPALALGNKALPRRDMAWCQAPPTAAGAAGTTGTAALWHANPVAMASLGCSPLHPAPTDTTGTPAICQHFQMP